MGGRNQRRRCVSDRIVPPALDESGFVVAKVSLTSSQPDDAIGSYQWRTLECMDMLAPSTSGRLQNPAHSQRRIVATVKLAVVAPTTVELPSYSACRGPTCHTWHTICEII